MREERPGSCRNRAGALLSVFMPSPPPTEGRQRDGVSVDWVMSHIKCPQSGEHTYLQYVGTISSSILWAPWCRQLNFLGRILNSSR